MRLGGKRKEAMLALLEVAAAPGDQRLNGRLLAERLHLPPRALEATLQQLARAGLLMAQRGPTGGYMLGREKRNISLKDIWLAVGEDSPDADSRHAALEQALSGAEQALLDYLGTITLEQLVKPIRATSDFMI